MARGGVRGQVADIAIWAVPFGLVGGRLYHVITDPELYFGEGGEPVTALYIWQGGLGIWGAIALGGVGAWIGCRRDGLKLPPSPTRWRPGIVLAQAIGRLGQLVQPGALRQAHRRCRGAWRSTRSTGRAPATSSTRRSTPPSSTSRAGTSASPALVIWADRGSGSATAGRSRST